MNKFKISVIVPTYNRYELLEYTLKSLESQSMKKEDYEVIICDDGSEDKTFQLIKKYIKKINLKYYFHKHEDFRAALTRNMGIQIAKGEICVFMDSGMIASEKYLQYHYESHRKNKVNCVVVGHILGFDISIDLEKKLKKIFDINDIELSFKKLLDAQFKDSREHTLNHIGNDMSLWPAPWIYFWSGNISVKKTELCRVGLFDEKYVGWGGEDTDLGIRLYLNNLKYVFSKEATAIHYPHSHIGTKIDNLEERILQRKTELCEKYNLDDMRLWIKIGSKEFNNILYDNRKAELVK